MALLYAVLQFRLHSYSAVLETSVCIPAFLCISFHFSILSSFRNSSLRGPTRGFGDRQDVVCVLLLKPERIGLGPIPVNVKLPGARVAATCTYVYCAEWF